MSYNSSHCKGSHMSSKEIWKPSSLFGTLLFLLSETSRPKFYWEILQPGDSQYVLWYVCYGRHDVCRYIWLCCSPWSCSFIAFSGFCLFFFGIAGCLTFWLYLVFVECNIYSLGTLWMWLWISRVLRRVEFTVFTECFFVGEGSRWRSMMFVFSSLYCIFIFF